MFPCVPKSKHSIYFLYFFFSIPLFATTSLSLSFVLIFLCSPQSSFLSFWFLHFKQALTGGILPYDNKNFCHKFIAEPSYEVKGK